MPVLNFLFFFDLSVFLFKQSLFLKLELIFPELDFMECNDIGFNEIPAVSAMVDTGELSKMKHTSALRTADSFQSESPL